MYDLTLNPQTQRVYNRLYGADFERLDTALESLKTNPRPRGTKKLTGNIFRIRIGDWRIIYSINDKDRLITIGKIARRSEDTYNGVKDLF